MISIERTLDAAILAPETPQAEMQKAIEHCLRWNVFSVCVRPCDIPAAKEMCKGTQTAVCTVLGFPHGTGLPEVKAAEAARYAELGVNEIDMVINYGLVRSGSSARVLEEITGVAAHTRPAGISLKVIFETAQLGPPEIAELVEISIQGGADFVKTSTGFNGEGARVEDVQLMLSRAAGRIKVKPSGGIRDAAKARMFLDMGVHRLGVNWASCASICDPSLETVAPILSPTY